jgi:acetyl esterase/lipase/GMP synthase-like glutamine amidotransferase
MNRLRCRITATVSAVVLPLLWTLCAAAEPTVQIEKDVAYLGADRQERGDLYRPATVAPGQRFPAVVIIHGGGWAGGDKGAAREINIGTTLAAHGYVGFSINYVLAAKGRATWPQNLYDCKTAVRWLRQNAARLHVDPDHLGVIGGSAGGHLAAMVALTGPESKLDPPGPYGQYSCRVQAAVDLYGPADLMTWLPQRTGFDMLPGTRAEKPELYRQASPATHADAQDPPLLILHGTADKTVDVDQSQGLAAALERAGTRHELVIVPDAPHSFHLQPQQRDLRPLVLGFFDRYLKSSTTPQKSASRRARDEAAVTAIWEKLYDRPQRLASLTKPVICLVDIQHPELIRRQLQTLPHPLQEARPAVLRERLKSLSGLDCLVVHQSEIRPADLDRPLLKAILFGGRSKTASRMLDEAFHPLIRTTRIPMIGLCGGCQLIGSAFGAKTIPLRKLRAGETDPNPKYHPGQFKEWGFLPVKVVHSDPLFAGLPAEIVVREMHAFQMSEPPRGFRLLASTAECRVQAIKHDTRNVYGVQFHPEAYDAEHPHGQILLKNFFRIALGTPTQGAASH